MEVSEIMEEEELKKYYMNIDYELIAVYKRKLGGLYSSTVFDIIEKENIFIEIIKSLLEKKPELKKRLLKGISEVL